MSQADDVIAALEQEIGQVRSDVTETLVDLLMDENPVLTGWSRANWIPTIGDPDLQPRLREGDPAGTPQQQGIAAIRGHTDVSEDQFVTNNVPYVPYLDAHHPVAEGYVERSVERAVDVAESKVDAQTERI